LRGHHIALLPRPGGFELCGSLFSSPEEPWLGFDRSRQFFAAGHGLLHNRRIEEVWCFGRTADFAVVELRKRGWYSNSSEGSSSIVATLGESSPNSFKRPTMKFRIDGTNQAPEMLSRHGHYFCSSRVEVQNFAPCAFVASSRGIGVCGVETGDATRSPSRSVGKLLCCFAAATTLLADDLVKVWLRKLASHWLQVTPKCGRGVDMRQFPSLKSPDRTLAHWMMAMQGEEVVVNIGVIRYIRIAFLFV
jgi:hypothetical protein